MPTKQDLDSVQGMKGNQKNDIEVLSFEGGCNSNRMNNAYDDIRGSANWSEKGESTSSIQIINKRRSGATATATIEENSNKY